MVRFASHPAPRPASHPAPRPASHPAPDPTTFRTLSRTSRRAPLFLVREHIPPENAYRLADACGCVDAVDEAEVAALEELEDEIATLAAHIHAATHRLLTLIAEFDRRRGWGLGCGVPHMREAPSSVPSNH